MTREKPTLGDAIRYLAGRCDFAQTLDGAGFNGVDAGFGHFLAEVPESQWKGKWARAAHKMLRKYRKQLAGAGIEYDALPVPPAEDVEPKPERPAVSQDRKITLDGGALVLCFPYDAAVVALVRTLQRRRFLPDTKCWRVTPKPEDGPVLRTLLTSHGFQADAAVEAVVAGLEQGLAAQAADWERSKSESRATSADVLVPGLRGTLRPFQAACLPYAARKKRVLVADTMGLGKTVEALAILEYLQAFPALVVCPASLKPSWERHAQQWLPVGRTVAVLNGTNPGPGWTMADVVVVNYDVLKVEREGRKVTPGPLVQKLLARGFRAVVFDEFHYCKNYKAMRTNAAKVLVKGAEVVLGLTGTPVLNRPQELTTPLEILGRLDEMGGFWGFLSACGLAKGRYGLEPIPEEPEARAQRLARVHERLRQVCMIRRTKEEVLPELPAKQRATVPLPINNRAEYQEAEADLIAWLEEQRGAEAAERASRAEQLARIEVLQALAARGKLDAAAQWVEDFLESGEKLVVFAHHVDVQDALAAKFPGCARVRGADSPAERDAEVQRFQTNPDCRLMVASLKAGGVGITLTAASNVAFMELGWTPGDMDQAEDRVHRIGQRDAVTAWYLLAERTVEEEKAALIDTKRATVDAVTDGAVVPVTQNILDALVDRLVGGRAA